MKFNLAFLLQLPLIVLVAADESYNHVNKTNSEIVREAANIINTTESAIVTKSIQNSASFNVTVENNTTTESTTMIAIQSTTMPDQSLLLIPPAKVESQIIKTNITPKNKFSSKIQAA